MLALGRWGRTTPAQEQAQRPPSLLPTIKCSNCNIDIEISRLADHECSALNQEPDSYEPGPPPPAKPSLTRAQTSDSTFPSSHSDRKSYGFLRPGMQPPPKIDATAANLPFARPPPGPLTPMSDYSNPRSVSPMTSNSIRRPPTRSATSPMPRPYSPPSPELNSNLDCAFPPWPNMSSRSNTPTSPMRSRERTRTNASSRLGEPSPLYAPVSPRFDAGASVVKKMDNISPGPFDGRRPSTSRGEEGTTAFMQGVQEKNSGHDRSRSTSSKGSRTSTTSVGLPSGPKAGNTLPPPPRPPRLSDDDESFEGIDSFLRRVRDEDGPPTSQPATTTARSGPFPSRSESRAGSDFGLPRRPSESGTRPRGQSNATISSVYSSDSATDAPPVPPMPSLDSLASYGAQRPGLPAFDKPQPSPLAVQRGPVESPLHTPSDSASSSGSMSGFDVRSASSASSAPGSDVGLPLRNPSRLANFPEDFSDSRQRQGSDLSESQMSPLSPVTPPRRPALGTQTGLGRANAPGSIPVNSTPSIPATVEEMPESPMDPAIQRGLISQQRPSVSKGSNEPRVGPPSSAPQNFQAPTTRPEGPLPRKPTGGNKGKCRGCSEQIIGKSVKAADGRLTGRWHKQCFTCKTCQEPFQTADFYVLNNFPYCEHHYHQLNNSLCQLCNRGIEGQFLETDKKKKYHPRCFTCSHCRTPLRDEYFEFNGRPYCERHAQHAASQNSMLGTGAKRFPERRTTKLMMMM